MAFFERADERDIKVECNICSVKVLEKGIMTHRNKCADKHKEKFTSGYLKKCEYDSNHIVEGDKMMLHLEFCTKRQSELVAEFQRTMRPDEVPLPEIKSDIWNPADHDDDQGDNDWGRSTRGNLVIKFKDLKLK